MGWSGGTYTKWNQGVDWVGDESAGIGIEAIRHDTQDNDFANGINNCLTKDGQNTPTTNLPMGGFKHINVAAATANDQYATYGQLTASVGASMPAGCIQMYGGSAAPTGFLLCDGGAVSRASYAALFAVVGTTYGAGDGSTTFNVPDLRQKFPLGKAASGTGNALGATGGAIDHTHSVPAHYHGKGNLAIGSSGTHTTSISHDHAAFNASGNTNTANPSHVHAIKASETTNTNHIHDTDGTSGERFATAPESGSQAGTYNSNSTDMTHSHPVTLSINVPSYSANSASNGAHTHASGDFSGSVGNTGGVNGDSAMTSGANNPPFLVVNYIIKT